MCGHWRKDLISESEGRGDISPFCFLALWQWEGSLVAMGLIFLICKNMALTHEGGHWGLNNTMIVKSIIVMELLHHLCLDITRKGEPITLKADGSFFEKF